MTTHLYAEAKKQVKFLCKDLSGRSVTTKMTAKQLKEAVLPMMEGEEENEFIEFVDNAEVGEEYLSGSFKIITL